ncbi:MAG TPA: non-homologous end-joining DNA ligase [Candidatus Acidoferrum sp.]|jgi:bifunctional non-homologous end joining protein LigD|nr:non-homologous end-joining DNA ligase [Candidatus Acidoferrum sp.]
MARRTAARATRDRHPATRTRGAAPVRASSIAIPPARGDVELDVGGRRVRLTNLEKLFFPEIGGTKRDLLQYYADVAPALLPHLRDRAMVMKRYPNGAGGDFFFMKRAPRPRPEWITTCAIEHASGSVIDFPIIDDLAALLWVINLGCIDLNQWYARCDDVDRPDYLHFDLDPVGEVEFATVREAAVVVNDTLHALGMPTWVKTTGSRGLHVYVPIVRGPTQKQVWEVSKTIALDVARRNPRLLTAVYKKAARPLGRVLVDYNQNAWGRTLASVYSVRPQPRATVSTPVTWDEVARGFALEDFRMDNVPARLAQLGDLWAPLNAPKGRFDLARLA